MVRTGESGGWGQLGEVFIRFQEERTVGGVSGPFFFWSPKINRNDSASRWISGGRGGGGGGGGKTILFLFFWSRNLKNWHFAPLRGVNFFRSAIIIIIFFLFKKTKKTTGGGGGGFLQNTHIKKTILFSFFWSRNLKNWHFAPLRGVNFFRSAIIIIIFFLLKKNKKTTGGGGGFPPKYTHKNYQRGV